LERSFREPDCSAVNTRAELRESRPWKGTTKDSEDA
jgi:hypothetical protein